MIDAAAGQGLACAHAPLDLPGPCILLPSIALPADKTSLAKEMLEERKRRKGNANRDMPRTPVLTLERQVELATLALTHVGKFRANQPTVKSTAVSKEGEHATTSTSAYVQKDEGSTGQTTAAVNAQVSGAAGGAKGKPSDAKDSSKGKPSDAKDSAKDCPPKDASDERETRETRLLDKLRCIERVLPPLVARTAYLSESPISEGRDAMRQHLWLEIERYSVSVLYWYKSANTDAAHLKLQHAAASRRRLNKRDDARATGLPALWYSVYLLYTGAKVRILTQKALLGGAAAMLRVLPDLNAVEAGRVPAAWLGACPHSTSGVGRQRWQVC